MHHARKVALTALALFVAGCVHYDVGAYAMLASREQRELAEPSAPILSERCDALAAGATALRDTNGTGWALRIPFGAGAAVGEFEAIHDRQAAVCREALLLTEGDGIPLSTLAEMNADWRSIWRDGDAVLVRGESAPDPLPEPEPQP